MKLSTIPIIASNSEKIIKGKEDNNKNNNNNNIILGLIYFVNAYSIINKKNSNFEYVSYSGLLIEGRMENERKIHLIISSLSIGLLIIILLFLVK